jgi:hypothetical protein
VEKLDLTDDDGRLLVSLSVESDPRIRCVYERRDNFPPRVVCYLASDTISLQNELSALGVKTRQTGAYALVFP